MVTAAAFDCPGCGAPTVLRAQGAVETVACEHCGSVIDARDPRHQILSRYKSKILHKPLIPLGARGTLMGEKWEAIGFMRRRTRYYGVDYEWSEYLLYNPYKGFRWLLEYHGHWTFLGPVNNPPQ